MLPSDPIVPRTADAVTSIAFSNTTQSVSRVMTSSSLNVRLGAGTLPAGTHPGYSKARRPVRACPTISVCISWVPS